METSLPPRNTPHGLLVVVGPSCAGKTTLVNELSKTFPKASKIITYKTRKKRDNERHMVDYYFCSEEEYFSLKQKDFFAESEQVHGEWSGTPKNELSNLDSDFKIISVDIRGALTLKEKYEHVHIFFVQTLSLDILEDRLRKRGQNNEESIKVRLKNALLEIEMAKNSNKVDLFLVNDDFSEMFNEAKRYVVSKMV